MPSYLPSILLQTQIVITESSQEKEVRIRPFHHRFSIFERFRVIRSESSNMNSIPIDELLIKFIFMLKFLIRFVSSGIVLEMLKLILQESIIRILNFFVHSSAKPKS